jgi:hypothetical protein
MLLEGAGPLGRIARDEVGMSADMIRTDAPNAAGLFAAVAAGSLMKQKK